MNDKVTLSNENKYAKKPSFWNVFWFTIMITFIGFGGGNALMPVIKKYAVEKYKWLTLEEFEENVVITNLLPGPSVIEAMSYTAIKLLGFGKGMIAIIFGILPHTIVAFLLFYFAQKLPTKYLYTIEVGVLVAIVGSLIGFGMQYFKRAQDKIKISLWITLFLITFAFCIFIPSPWNMPVFIMVLVIVIFYCIVAIKRKNNKKQNKAKGGE